jgi:hypothetical protein
MDPEVLARRTTSLVRLPEALGHIIQHHRAWYRVSPPPEEDEPGQDET